MKRCRQSLKCKLWKKEIMHGLQKKISDKPIDKTLFLPQSTTKPFPRKVAVPVETSAGTQCPPAINEVLGLDL